MQQQGDGGYLPAYALLQLAAEASGPHILYLENHRNKRPFWSGENDKIVDLIF